MNILALDASGEYISIVLAKGEEEFGQEKKAARGQNEFLMPFIDEVFKKAKLLPSELNAIVCTRGPGSFTGLRIAFAAVKGLSLATNAPFYTENTLLVQGEAYNNNYVEKHGKPLDAPLLSLIDAKGGRFFAMLLKDGKKTGDIFGLYQREEILETINLYKNLYICGGESFLSILGEIPNPNKTIFLPSLERGFAQELLPWGKKYIKSKKASEKMDAALEYMKKSEAEETRAKREK